MRRRKWECNLIILQKGKRIGNWRRCAMRPADEGSKGLGTRRKVSGEKGMEERRESYQLPGIILSSLLLLIIGHQEALLRQPTDRRERERESIRNEWGQS